MTISTREKRLLAVLGIVAAIGGFRWLWILASPPPPPAPVAAAFDSTTSRGSRRGGRSQAGPPDRVVVLETARLDQVPPAFSVGRDLFSFGPPPAPPPPPPPTAEELARRRELEAARRRQAEIAALEAAKPRPPALTLRYLGSFGPEWKRIAVFTDAAGQSVWNAQVGDVLDGKFVVDRIGLESVDLKFIGFDDVPPARLAVGE